MNFYNITYDLRKSLKKHFQHDLTLQKWDLVGLEAWQVSSYFYTSFSPIASPCRANFLTLHDLHHLPSPLLKATVKIRRNPSRHQADQVPKNLWIYTIRPLKQVLVIWNVCYLPNCCSNGVWTPYLGNPELVGTL